jgi:uncharacterized protein (TIGR03435 family)
MQRGVCALFFAFCFYATPQDTQLKFNVASVRVRVVESAKPGTGHLCRTPASCLSDLREKGASDFGGPGTSDPGRMTFRGVSMETLLSTAFAVQFDQISAPASIQEWLVKNRSLGVKYDIVAEVPPGATKEDAQKMLASLLLERFGLVYHIQTRDFEGYRLTVAKGGPKLKPAAPADGPERILPPGTRQPFDDHGFPVFQPGYPSIKAGIQDGVAHLAARMVTTEDLLLTLQRWLGYSSRVENRTGLNEKYDFKLEFADTRSGVAAVNAPSVDALTIPAPDLFTALERQLGLKLESVKVPVDVVVVDHLNQQPTDN